jgi:hypothetical protein
MSEADRQWYTVNIFEPADSPGMFVFTFVPKGLQHDRGMGGAPGRVRRYVVRARRVDAELMLDWTATPDDPGTARSELDREVRARLGDRDMWIDRVTKLVNQVEAWVKELGWETRRIEKRLDDSRIGTHIVPALLMQKETSRVLLEPVGRSAPGADGVVDLYLMPAYDDIASLYFYDGHWSLHYAWPGTSSVAAVREAKAEPLSREALGRALEEMKAHAA